MNSIDIHVTIEELQSLVGYWLDNIYVTRNIYLFKFQGKGKLRRPLLLIEPGKRIHLTELQREIPSPGPKTLQLRRLIKGARLTRIQQQDMDRLVLLDFSLPSKEKPYQFIIELFGKKANLIVVDTNNNNRIIFANWYRKMRDRDVLPGKPFILPPSRGKFLLDITEEELANSLISVKNAKISVSNPKTRKNKRKKTTIVSFLATTFGGGGELAEEILARASIPKDIPLESFPIEQCQQLMAAINEIKTLITEKEWKPCITHEDHVPISVDPFLHISIKGERKYFSTFQEALDKYFSELEQPHAEEIRKKEQEILKWKTILQQQEVHLETLKEEQKRFQRMGDLLYEHFQEVSEIIKTIQEARKKNIDWDTILEKIEMGRKKGIKSARLIHQINPNTAEITLKLDNKMITIDFRKSVSENADEFYARAKKANRKIEPAMKKVEETRARIETLKNLQQEIIESTKIILKRRPREWYEKFHWLFTSAHNLLVIAGKDVKTNEILAKRYLEPNDLFFHAEITGAPYTILKIPPKVTNISEIESDIQEAAILAGVFSKAWKAGYGSVDVYYVQSNQVSFSAPSGEYLPRGGIMIRGKRTYIKNIPMEWAIGLLIHSHHARVISGPPDTIDKKTGIYVIIKPGELKKGQCAKKIKSFFENQAEEDDKPKIRALDLNEIVEHIPGNSKIVKTVSNPDFYPLLADEVVEEDIALEEE